MLRTALVLLAALGAASPSCRGQVRAPDDAIEAPAKLRTAIQSRTGDFSAARFKEVVLEYFGKDERVKVRQLILVKHPENVRVQTRVPGSNEIANLLVTDGESFALHRRRSNRYVTGPPTRANINRLLPVDLSARDIVRVMFGGAPWDRLDSAPGEPSLEWNTDAGRYEYSVPTEKDGRLIMVVDHDPYRVRSVVERDSDGELVYRYRADDWVETGPHTIPTYRRFVWPERNLDFSLDIGEIESGVDLTDGLFQLAPPPGSTIRRVGSDGGPTSSPTNGGDTND